MTIKTDFIKKSGIEKEYSELDIKRFDYLEERPNVYIDEVIIADGVELTDIYTSEKTSSKGEKYTSQFAKLIFYIDDDEMKVSFPFNIWKPIKDGIVKIKRNNPLTNLIKEIANDERHNNFDIDYTKLQEIVEDIKSITIKPKVIASKNGFETYGFEVVNIEWV